MEGTVGGVRAVIEVMEVMNTTSLHPGEGHWRREGLISRPMGQPLCPPAHTSWVHPVHGSQMLDTPRLSYKPRNGAGLVFSED